MLLKRQHSHREIQPYYRAADLCLVTSLHDGMNLVAKELHGERGDDEQGVLILSRFAGASQELSDALIVNPYDTEELADTIHRALEMPPDERSVRMQRMRAIVRERNVYRWAGNLIGELCEIRPQKNLQAGAGEDHLGGVSSPMQHLFECWKEIADRLNGAHKIALFLDFDGTLTRIRPQPEEALLSASTRRTLSVLARSPRFRITVISGRKHADIRARIRVPGIRYLGLHGWDKGVGDPLSEREPLPLLACVKSMLGGLPSGEPIRASGSKTKIRLSRCIIAKRLTPR